MCTSWKEQAFDVSRKSSTYAEHVNITKIYEQGAKTTTFRTKSYTRQRRGDIRSRLALIHIGTIILIQVSNILSSSHLKHEIPL